MWQQSSGAAAGALEARRWRWRQDGGRHAETRRYHVTSQSMLGDLIMCGIVVFVVGCVSFVIAQQLSQSRLVDFIESGFTPTSQLTSATTLTPSDATSSGRTRRKREIRWRERRLGVGRPCAAAAAERHADITFGERGTERGVARRGRHLYLAHPGRARRFGTAHINLARRWAAAQQRQHHARAYSREQWRMEVV
jgi:hypothetical protein